jgi:hypothetical protein
MVEPLHWTVFGTGVQDKLQDLGILHHYVQSLGNKLLELNAMLSSWSSKPAILCFSEHWLQRDHFIHINIDKYKSADSSCTNIDKHGGFVFCFNWIKNKRAYLLKEYRKGKNT